MEEKEFKKKYYKIEAGDTVTVFRSDYNGKAYYKASVSKKNYDKTISYFTKQINFPKGTDIADRTKIKVIDFFEDVRENPKDKYNPIWSLFIQDYEIVEEQEALAEFNDSLEEYDIDESQLPF